MAEEYREVRVAMGAVVDSSKLKQLMLAMREEGGATVNTMTRSPAGPGYRRQPTPPAPCLNQGNFVPPYLADERWMEEAEAVRDQRRLAGVIPTPPDGKRCDPGHTSSAQGNKQAAIRRVVQSRGGRKTGLQSSSSSLFTPLQPTLDRNWSQQEEDPPGTGRSVESVRISTFSTPVGFTPITLPVDETAQPITAPSDLCPGSSTRDRPGAPPEDETALFSDLSPPGLLITNN